MLDRVFESLTVNGEVKTNVDLSTDGIVAGAPVTASTDGYILAKKDNVVAGLSVNYFTSWNDEVAGGDFHLNSGKIGIFKIGEAVLDKDIYFAADGTKVEVFPYDSSLTYSVNDELFVNAQGVITNTAGDKNDAGTNKVGRVVVPPTATSSAMKIYVNIAA